MKIHRFIIACDNLEPGETFVINNPRVVYQITRVLRFKSGDLIAVCDGNFKEAKGRIQEISKESVTVLVESVEMLEHPKRETVLYCSIIKKDNFELVVQKATEVGVMAIIPVISKRVVKLGLRFDRLQNIALEASEQSGRGRAPKIYEPVEFIEAVKRAKEENDQNIIFDLNGEHVEKTSLLKDKVGVFIGPEGGFDESELKIAKEENFNVVSLGNLTLRAETAAIVASYIISNKFYD